MFDRCDVERKLEAVDCKKKVCKLKDGSCRGARLMDGGRWLATERQAGRGTSQYARIPVASPSPLDWQTSLFRKL